MQNKKIITANCGDDSISIIEKACPDKLETIYLRDLVVKNNKVIEFQTGDKIGPTSLSLDSSGNLLVVNAYDDSLFRIDLERKILTDGLKLGRYPTVIQIYGNRIFILNSDSDSLSVVDEEELVLVESIHIDGRPSDMKIDEERKSLYIVSSNSHNLNIIDLNFHRLNILGIPSQPLKIKMEGDLIFIMGFVNNGILGYSNLFAIEKMAYRMIWYREIKGIYYDFIKIKGLDYFYLINAEDGHLYELDIRSGRLQRKTRVGNLPNNIVYDGHDRLYINDLLNGQIFIVNLGDMSKIERYIKVGKEPQDILLL